MILVRKVRASPVEGVVAITTMTVMMITIAVTISAVLVTTSIMPALVMATASLVTLDHLPSCQPRPALTAVTPNLAQSNFVVLYSLGERVRFRLGDLHLTIKDQEQSWLEEIVQDIFLSRVSIY